MSRRPDQRLKIETLLPMGKTTIAVTEHINVTRKTVYIVKDRSNMGESLERRPGSNAKAKEDPEEVREALTAVPKILLRQHAKIIGVAWKWFGSG